MTLDLPTATSTVTPRGCRRHRWYIAGMDDGVAWYGCHRCDAIRDPVRSHRGRSAGRFGKDQERRIERVHGPLKVGEFGDAIDLLGRDFAWQSKASRGRPPVWMSVVTTPVLRLPTALVTGCALAMAPIAGARMPLVIQTFVRRDGPKGERTRDWIWVRAVDWWDLHAEDGEPVPSTVAWLVMSGDAFLQQHGRDEPLR